MMRKTTVSFDIPHLTFATLFSLISTLPIRSSPPSENNGKRKRSVVPPAGNIKLQKDGFLSSVESNDSKKIKKSKRHQHGRMNCI
jgi:hypothetical protein